MIEILATLPQKEYISFFVGDWAFFSVLGGLIWAFKDKFKFNLNNDQDQDEWKNF